MLLKLLGFSGALHHAAESEGISWIVWCTRGQVALSPKAQADNMGLLFHGAFAVSRKDALAPQSIARECSEDGVRPPRGEVTRLNPLAR